MSWPFLFFWFFAALAALIHVYRESRILGESAVLHCCGTLLLWPLYYLGWILWWPGSLRLACQGKSIRDLTQAKNLKRVRDRQIGRSHRD
ncbi:MAG: hypothetical protein KDN19_11995 [Verrucomicrobiae bacterium]|nr:hypothetical protein [Verrucomicrobiae bacterium]